MTLAAGATGSLGRRITRGLREQGKEVRILARHNSPSVGSLLAAGCQVVYGDPKDPASLNDAYQGAEMVITTATATQRWGEDTVENVDSHGTLALIQPARLRPVRGARFHPSMTYEGA